MIFNMVYGGGGGDLSDVTLWIADFSTWDGVTVTKGDKDTDGREITALGG